MRSTRFPVLLLSMVLVFAAAASAATYTVTKVADTNDGTCDADCSFREAVAAANATADNDSIVFSSLFATSQTIVLSLNEIVIGANGSLTVTGPGANLLTMDGNLASRIISTGANVNAEISGIRFTRGNGVGALNTGRGGAIYNVGGILVLRNVIVDGNSAPNGGGLNNAGSTAPAIPATLTIENSIVSNNTATGSGGGMQNFSTSTVTITSSLFTGNISNGTTGGGGGQFNGGVRITNSTFAGNSAPAGGGGGMQSNGTLGTILTNVTFSGNSAATNGGGIHRGTTNPNFFMRNTIVAGNNGPAASPDFTNSAAGNTSQGNNIIGNTGTSTGWVASDLLNTNPLLGPLANNGGPTQTFLPQAGSPAIEGGQNCVLDSSCSANNAPFNVTTDQRGVARPAGPVVDIGSVEVAATAATATITGRVLTADGRPIRGAIVLQSGPIPALIGNPFQPVAYTSSFGYFTISGVPTGQSYQITATAKGHSFTPQIVAVTGDISDFVLIANPAAAEGEGK